jgi:hypothetical protein
MRDMERSRIERAPDDSRSDDSSEVKGRVAIDDRSPQVETRSSRSARSATGGGELTMTRFGKLALVLAPLAVFVAAFAGGYHP